MNNRTLFVIRGVPGTGKSTLARKIAGRNIASADDFFMQINSDGDEVYNFQPAQLGNARRNCQYRISQMMSRGVSPIAVHDHFLKNCDWEPYVRLCSTHGYTPFVIACSSVLDKDKNFTDDVLQRMKNDFEFDFFENQQNLDCDTAGNEVVCPATRAMTARMRLVTED